MQRYPEFPPVEKIDAGCTLFPEFKDFCVKAYKEGGNLGCPHGYGKCPEKGSICFLLLGIHRRGDEGKECPCGREEPYPSYARSVVKIVAEREIEKDSVTFAEMKPGQIGVIVSGTSVEHIGRFVQKDPHGEDQVNDLSGPRYLGDWNPASQTRHRVRLCDIEITEKEPSCKK
jgi:hypothetical protein